MMRSATSAGATTPIDVSGKAMLCEKSWPLGVS
jgi:hypothetical protein